MTLKLKWRFYHRG